MLVFQARGVEVDEIRGFSVAEEPMPVICLNSKDAPPTAECSPCSTNSATCCYGRRVSAISVTAGATHPRTVPSRYSATRLQPRSPVIRSRRDPIPGGSSCDLLSFATMTEGCAGTSPHSELRRTISRFPGKLYCDAGDLRASEEVMHESSRAWAKLRRRTASPCRWMTKSRMRFPRSSPSIRDCWIPGAVDPVPIPS